MTNQKVRGYCEGLDVHITSYCSSLSGARYNRSIMSLRLDLALMPKLSWSNLAALNE